ncbi:M48 family metalloprotease [Catellatospora citrea]|uniref:M48 family metalloprotease n=1 Tax=Catellatospora citrea TaxID=53366 RepID=UPI0011C40689|nr:M48 family metallopeptidase [Catellatospora citrea]
MSIIPTAVQHGLCPQCQSALAVEPGEAPWCARCEWNLDAFTPDPLVGRLTNLQERWAHRIGYELDRDLFAQLSGRPLTRPGSGGVSAALTIISLVLAAVLLGLAAGGVWLLIAGHFLVKLIGLVMVAFAVLCRPRLGRLRDVHSPYDEVTWDRQPRLFAFVDRVAQAVGAPLPHVLVLSHEWNASATVVGFARRRVLTLGLPLWTALRPQERVALLAHELGHFINNDNRRNLRTQTALTFFAHVAHLLDPRELFGRTEFDGLMELAVKVVELAVAPVFWLLSRLCWLLHLAMHVLGARASQRSEYYADDLAARAAGSTAALTLTDVASCSDSYLAIVGSRARGGAGMQGWREAVESARAAVAPRQARLRQLTLRRAASPFSSHPPAELRHRVIAAQPHRDPQVVLGEAEAAAIDAELAAFEERYRRIIAAAW